MLRTHYHKKIIRSLALVAVSLSIAACNAPDPPETNLPTSPAVLVITPAPTLDIDATATSYAVQMRPTPTPAGLYIVRDGDTLSDIAERYHTTVEEIMVFNGMTDANLQVGQELIIPSLVQTPIPAETPSPSEGELVAPVTNTGALETTPGFTETNPITTP